MAAKSALEKLVDAFDIHFNLPAKPQDLARLAGRFELKLPAALSALYSRGNGGTAKRKGLSLELLPLAAVKKYPAGFFKSAFGYFPIADNNDSNPICVCCKPPLAGYVVQVHHDDSPQLLFRSLDEFYLAALSALKRQGDFHTDDLTPAFALPKRSGQDATVAGKLIAMAAQKKVSPKWDAADALRFACDLLPDKQVKQIVALLETPDPYVREHVEHRLKTIKSPTARRALAGAAGGYEEFVKHCAALLKKAGVAASVHAPYGKPTLRVDKPQVAWLNMDFYYDERERAEFADYFVAKVKAATKR